MRSQLRELGAFYSGLATFVFTLQLLVGVPLVLGLMAARVPVLDQYVARPASAPETTDAGRLAERRLSEQYSSGVRAGYRFSLDITQDDLNSIVPSIVESNRDTLPLRDVWVRVNQDTFEVSADPDWLPGLRLWAEVSASARGGAPRFAVERAAVGLMPVPLALVQAPLDMLNETILTSWRTSPVGVERVDVFESRLRVVVGRR